MATETRRDPTPLLTSTVGPDEWTTSLTDMDSVPPSRPTNPETAASAPAEAHCQPMPDPSPQSSTTSPQLPSGCRRCPSSLWCWCLGLGHGAAPLVWDTELVPSVSVLDSAMEPPLVWDMELASMVPELAKPSTKK
ncbi:hypothetical protein CEXT_434801 [Caerostris extrusa]|uniref:Uncharacterized protein n=1 Tax=Caerostris extrusa TaxID=172846 RepID=A0AAV4XRI1_CAEEX|nr:hypothetical protein CEXT_434801 [Caerostris extrusa]